MDTPADSIEAARSLALEFGVEFRAEVGGDALEHVGELADGGGEDDEVAGGEGLASGDGVGEGFVDGVAVEGGLEGGGVGAADAEDACGELAFFECEAEGGAEETDAEDGDAGEGF